MGRKSKVVDVSENIKINESILPEFIDICKLSQKSLKMFLKDKLVEAGYEDVVSKDGYLYAKGEIPILLTAHMDTVHKERVATFTEIIVKDKHRLSSAQGIGGDDRCGVYIILQLIKTHKCSILFCEDEETGGRGSRKFTKSEHMKDLSDVKYMIELDRANAKDAVFYNCDNKKFTKFICSNTGYKEKYGSFSDISVLAPEAKVAAVNLSCGYYSAHTTGEYVVIEEMQNTVEVVRKLLDVECDQFEYVRKTYGYDNCRNYNFRDYYGDSWYRGNRGVNFGGMDVWEDDVEDKEDYFTTAARKLQRRGSQGSYRRNYDNNEYDMMTLYVVYNAGTSYVDREEVCVTGNTKDELWHKFFRKYSNVCMDMVEDYYYDYI